VPGEWWVVEGAGESQGKRVRERRKRRERKE
jgi:hypothetical protein